MHFKIHFIFYRLIYEFSRFINKVWFGKWRVYDARSFVFSIYKLNPNYRSYGFHDAFVKTLIKIFFFFYILKGNVENFSSNNP